jgi:flavin-dependent dehydrogenase
MNELLPSTEPAPGPKPAIVCDVTVIGGGLAGKAASLQLARAGLGVTCIEPQGTIRQPIGESLDWSAPELLSALGLPMNDLINPASGSNANFSGLAR